MNNNELASLLFQLSCHHNMMLVVYPTSRRVCVIVLLVVSFFKFLSFLSLLEAVNHGEPERQ